LAKPFVQEQGSERLIALVEPLTHAQKLVSSLSGVEVHSAIRRRERAGDLSPALSLLRRIVPYSPPPRLKDCKQWTPRLN